MTIYILRMKDPRKTNGLISLIKPTMKLNKKRALPCALSFGSGTCLFHDSLPYNYFVELKAI
jgi:hypothetical protein